MDIKAIVDPATVEWTEDDERQLTILQTRKAMVQKIKRDDLIALVDEIFPTGDLKPEHMADALIANATKVVDCLDSYYTEA